MLFGQRLGLETVAGWRSTRLASSDCHAALLLTALSLARRQPMLFAAVATAIVVYGLASISSTPRRTSFSASCGFCAAILALDRPAPILRGMVLPLAAVVLLRTYEGMLLVGPVLALWAVVAAGARARTDGERVGSCSRACSSSSARSSGLVASLAPRDPSNAAGFLASTFRYPAQPAGVPVAFGAARAFRDRHARSQRPHRMRHHEARQPRRRVRLSRRAPREATTASTSTITTVSFWC